MASNRSKAVKKLLEAIEGASATPALTKEDCVKEALKSVQVDLQHGVRLGVRRELAAEPEVLHTNLKGAAARAVEGLKEVMKAHPEIDPSELRAQIMVMNGQGTDEKYDVDINGNITSITDEKDFPAYSAQALVKHLDKLKLTYGEDAHKDITLPDDPNQAAIIQAVNKLHRQRHEQVDVLLQLLQALAVYEAVAETSPAEGSTKTFIRYTNTVILKVLKEQSCICALYDALNRIGVPGHSRLELALVN